MSGEVFVFFLILLINVLVTFVYWLFFFVFRKEHEAGFASRCVAMLLFPVIGPVYFFLGWLLRKIFFHKPVELTDVIFSKEREKSLLKSDEERENNILPIKDAVTVVDKQNARELMLEVLRHDVRKSLSSLFLALNSDDSEISHYAASVLQSELGKFRLDVQNVTAEIDETEEQLRACEKYDAERKLIFADLSDKLEESEDYDRHETFAYEQGMRAYYGDDAGELTIRQKLSEQAQAAHELIESIYEVLRQNVLSELESIHFTELTDRMAHLLEKRDTLSAEEMARIAECWRLRKNFEKCSLWSDRLCLVYPDALEAFSTKLKLLYDMHEREQFFATLEEMKKTGVPLNHEMMEMVRVFM